MKKLSILGATGSIGRNTLAVVDMFPGRFQVCALSAKKNVQRLAEQIHRFNPDVAAVYDEDAAAHLKSLLPPQARVRVVWGEAGYAEAARWPAATMVVSAMVGAAGLRPTLAAVEAGKDIALANKETLVMAGQIVMRRAAQKNVRIVPVDSEHSAIFQCLQGNRRADVEKIFLTASGGPFAHLPASAFADISPADALQHPNWEMGQKITIDSATLMNKGLEVIEAKHLFDLELSQIEVVVHPQSIVHSMVAYRDASVMAQLGLPDMKGAIAYALSYPERLPLNLSLPDFASLGRLTFQPPDTERFPCLDFAFKACQIGGTAPAVLNAANEVAVAAFLQNRIGFVQIPKVIRQTMELHTPAFETDADGIFQADRWGRDTAHTIINQVNSGIDGLGDCWIAGLLD